MPSQAGQAKLRALLDALEKAYTDGDEQPTWAGEDALRYVYYVRTMAYIPNKDPQYESLISIGAILIRSQVCVSSVEHAIALSTDSITEGTAEAPSPVKYVVPPKPPKSDGTPTPPDPLLKELPDELKSGYTVNALAIKASDRQMFKDALSGITVKSVRDAEAKRAGSKSGAALFASWAKWIKDHETDYWPFRIILEYQKEYRGSGEVCYSGIFPGI